jgi:uncharacterized DUF497 family protein
MVNDEFEWDDAKALENKANHGVTFESATLVFRDVFGVGWIDDREDYGEERGIRIGMAKDKLLFVAYTERGERKRIISARNAEKPEQDSYYQQNSGE